MAYPQKTSGITAEIIEEDDLVLIQSHHNPIIWKKRISVPQLNELKFIALSPKTPTQQAIMRFFRENKITPNIVREYDNIETLKISVLLGLGCGIVPRNTVVQEVKENALEIVPVKGLEIARRFYWIIRPDDRMSPAARVFCTEVLKHA